MPENLFNSLPENLPKPKVEEPKFVIPEQLKGKSPEEMYQMLSDENERLLREERDKAEQEYKKSTPPPIQGQQRQQPSYPQQYPQQYQQQNEPDPYTDPEGFMDVQFQRRMQPLVNNTVNSLRSVNRSNFTQAVAKEDWEKYSGEVEAIIDNFSPQIQMHPDAYKQAYNIVLANHMDEVVGSKAEKIASERLQRTLLELGIGPEQLQGVLNGDGPPKQEERPSLFQRNVGVRTPVTERANSSHTPYSPPKGSGGLSQEEKEIAKKFGMEPDEYKDWAKLNTDMISQLGGDR